jgi:hypothetical protein
MKALEHTERCPIVEAGKDDEQYAEYIGHQTYLLGYIAIISPYRREQRLP